MAQDTARTGSRRVAGALLGVSMVLIGGAACSSEPPPPPARQYTVQFSVTGTSGTGFGRYVTVGELGSNQQVNFSGVPFELTMTVPYDPQPKLQASLVDVPPGSRLSCRISVDGRTVASQTITVPGQDVICGAG